MPDPSMTRRRFAEVIGGAVASLALGTACHARAQRESDARIKARPRPGVKTQGSGTQPLGLGGRRDAVLHLPADTGAPLPLLVLLHGAGGSGANMLRRIVRFSDDAGIAVLSPDSRAATWDVIRSGFGPDIRFIDTALERVFESVAIDPARITVGGFSDGASYAISVGLQNGDLFRRVLAWSPGFYVGGPAQGRPRFFVSHGTADQILPIDRCSRIIVPALKKQGYDVTFRPFDGGHEVPPHLASEGLKWAAEK
jgi:phospholipase/carboxylesterase